MVFTDQQVAVTSDVTRSTERLSVGALSLRNISKWFIDVRLGRNLAVDQVSLEIPPGQFCALVGASGCGKSTILKMIAGLLPPSKGEILMDGRRITKPGADRAMVFQEYAVFPWSTVLGNVQFPLKMAGMPKTERHNRAMEFIRLVGLEGVEHRYPRELSGGMRQRVAVARALANQPPVLLMDEPFAAVDALTRSTLQEELVRIWQATQCTVVFVTHSVDEAVFLSDRVVVLSRPNGPQSVQADLQIQLPRPRRWVELAESEEFRRPTREVLAVLRDFPTSSFADVA